MRITIFVFIVALVTPAKEYAQTPLNKSIPVQSGQIIVMHFDYPELVQISTWDKNEIQIQGNVSINNGENDEAFLLQTSTNGKTINIQSEIKDLKNLPQRVTISRGNEKVIFKNKAAFKKYQEEHGKDYDMMSTGAHIDIHLEIKVPRHVETQVVSVYGMVEVKNFEGPLTVEATYGGVDAALAERSVGELTAQTNHGEIYSNFDAKFGGDKFDNEVFHTFVSARPGQGPKYNFESKYGNVYIRKATH